MEKGCLDIFPKWDLPYLSVGLFTRVSAPAKSMELLAIPRAICFRIRGRDGGRITGSSGSPTTRDHRFIFLSRSHILA